MTRIGSWMQTYSGDAFWPLDPRPDEIDPDDIGHALSQLCRYGGHTISFYSVAEHCVLMSHAVAPEHALAALLHDATEAYVVDLPRPIKRHLPDYAAIENGVAAAIAQRFGIDPVMPPAVKDADNRILLDERADLLTTPPYPWVQDLEGLEPLGVEIRRWPPRIAEVKYIDRLHELLEEAHA